MGPCYVQWLFGCLVIPNLTCLDLKLFATYGCFNQIVTITQKFVTLTFTTPRNVSELNILHSKEHTRVFYTIYCSFYVEKQELTECSDVWSNSTLSVQTLHGGIIV